jgi:hypothetical protein
MKVKLIRRRLTKLFSQGKVSTDKMAIGNWAKRKAKQATKAVGKRYGVSYGRRGVRASKNSFSKLAKDVMMIKASLNVEKKYKDTLEEDAGSVGQVNVNADGRYAVNVTPVIGQGVGESQRVGNSIKATGLVLKFNMIKQNQAEGNRRLCIRLVRSVGGATTPSDAHEQILDLNPFVPVRDYNSNLDYTQFKDGKLKVIATKNVYFPQNGGDSMNLPNEAMTKSVTMAVKLNEVLRYGDNSDNTPENVKYFLIITCDNGNAGGTASSILGVTVPDSNSAIDFKLHSRFWYVDN